MISDKQLLAKVESNEDLTVDEVKRYYQITKTAETRLRQIRNIETQVS